MIKHVAEGGDRRRNNLRTARNLWYGGGSNNFESNHSFGGMSEGADGGNNNDNLEGDHAYNLPAFENRKG